MSIICGLGGEFLSLNLEYYYFIKTVRWITSVYPNSGTLYNDKLQIWGISRFDLKLIIVLRLNGRATYCSEYFLVLVVRLRSRLLTSFSSSDGQEDRERGNIGYLQGIENYISDQLCVEIFHNFQIHFKTFHKCTILW